MKEVLSSESYSTFSQNNKLFYLKRLRKMWFLMIRPIHICNPKRFTFTDLTKLEDLNKHTPAGDGSIQESVCRA